MYEPKLPVAKSVFQANYALIYTHCLSWQHMNIIANQLT